MQLWHLTYSSDARHPLLADEPSRRAAVRKLAAVAGGELVLFSLLDDHLHLVVRAERRRAGRLSQAVFRKLEPAVAWTLEPAHRRLVESRSHMQWLLTYLLNQVSHHQNDADPALWSGSCFQDLAGARLVDGLRLQLQEALPRFKLRMAYAAVGLPPTRIEPAGDHQVRAAGAARLVDAASSALAVPSPPTRRRPPHVEARRAVAQLARQIGLAGSEVAWALGESIRTMHRHRAEPVRPEVLTAIRMRLALEEAVHSARRRAG